MQQCQLIDVGLRQQVAAHREHLSEFEKDETQFFDGFTYLLRCRPMRPTEHGAQNFVAREHAQDLQQARCRLQHSGFFGSIIAVIRGLKR